MLIGDFDFELPESAIARFPLERRDASRLLVLDRSRGGAIEHRVFSALPQLLRAGDVLVVNNTRVLPARLRARKAASGGRVEILLVEPIGDSLTRWRVMVNASKPVRAQALLVIDQEGSRIPASGTTSSPHSVREPPQAASATVVEEEGEGFVILEFSEPAELLAERTGEIPLPPYLGRAAEESDHTRYNTVYAAGERRSVAAPTAGLHFTEELLAQLEQRGVERAELTLNVGPGTFLPVRTDNIDEHHMWPERFEVSASAAQTINQARGRVIAVGTTVTRVLETLGRPLEAARGNTDLFIRPGHNFRAVDALITNFHLPRSTLLMLVAAFAGREPILAAYREAITRGYRFYSYGDAMFIS